MQRPLRLSHSLDFERARLKGKTWRQRWVHLNSVPNGLAHNRYGFIVSKRVGGAVMRNRVKRQLRSALRTLHPTLAVGHDLIWIARNEIVGQPYSDIMDAVRELCRTARLIDRR